MLKPVLHHADGPVSGLQDAYGLDLGVLFDTDEIGSCEGDDHDPEELLDTLKVHQMGVLDVEAACFHPAEARLDLPPLLIAGYGELRPAERYDDLQLGHPAGVFESRAGKVAQLPLDSVYAAERKLLPVL